MRTLTTLLVTITLAEMMFAMGLRLSFSRLTASLKGSGMLVMRAFAANFLLIPLVTLAVIRLFDLSPPAALGLLILGVSPAAPYALPFTLLAGGNLALAAGLMVLLAASSALLAPLLLHGMLPLAAGTSSALIIDPVALSGTLFIIQLLPLSIGLACGQWKPAMARRLEKPAGQASKILNAAMILAIVSLQYRALASTGPVMFLIVALPVLAGLMAGWILGWPGYANRKSMSVLTAMRNMSLAIGIASASLAGPETVTIILVFSFVAGSGVLLTAALMRMIRQ